MTQNEQTADGVVASSLYVSVYIRSTQELAHSGNIHKVVFTSLLLVDLVAEYIIELVYVLRTRCYVLDMQAMLLYPTSMIIKMDA